MKLVKVLTRDGLELDGIFVRGESSAVIVHVHGKCGNFYQNAFIADMAERYPAAGIHFLSVNNRGHDCMTEFYQNGHLTYHGGSFEKFDECLVDIDAMVEFARQFGSRVILQGHSHGCEKILHYAMKRQSGLEIILLSPSDSAKLQDLYIAPEPMAQFMERLEHDVNLNPGEWVGPQDYGIRIGGKEYSIPIQRCALLDWISSPSFHLMSYDRPWPYPTVDARGFVYLGGRDPIVAAPMDAAVAGMKARIRNVTFEIDPDGDHHFSVSPGRVINSIVRWVIGE